MGKAAVEKNHVERAFALRVSDPIKPGQIVHVSGEGVDITAKVYSVGDNLMWIGAPGNLCVLFRLRTGEWLFSHDKLVTVQLETIH